MTFFYRISGLNVASDLAFAGMIAALAVESVDVHIRRGVLPASLSAATANGPNWQLNERQLLVEIPAVVRLLVSDGEEILFEPAEGVSEPDVEIFLSGTGIGLVLHQRGQIALHASAILVGDKAVLFCGASGVGKSTIAAALGKRGYGLVTDDIAAISMRNGAAFVESDGRWYKLWEQAIDGLNLGARRGVAVRSCLAKFHVEPSRSATNALPVGAIYHLREARPPHDEGIARPNMVDAGLIVRRNAYRPAMVKRLGQQEVYFANSAALVQAGVFTLTRRLGFEHLPDTLAALERHWADCGIAAAA
jgi:hypothetical protein